MNQGHITNEDFKKHTEEDARNFAGIIQRIDASEEERRKRHEEVMTMFVLQNNKLQPVYDAFDLKRKLSEVGMRSIVRWTKILGFVIAVIAVLVYLWNIFKFGITQIIK